MTQERIRLTMVLTQALNWATTITTTSIAISLAQYLLHSKGAKTRLKSENKLEAQRILKLLPLRDRRNISIAKWRETTLSSSTKWSIKQRCAETGNYFKNANFRTTVRLLMGSMNCTRKHTCLQTTKQNFANSSMLLHIVPMETVVSFCILSLICLRIRVSTSVACWTRMRD